MSVILKGIDIPTGCASCWFGQYLDSNRYPYCKLTSKEVQRHARRNDDCPLIELPPHGRLIDADVAEVIVTDEKDEVGGFLDGILYAAEWIANQPTIIEAEEEKT